MRILAIDIETYSSVNLGRAGVYAYCSSPDFSILLFAYAFDTEEVQVVDLETGEKLPLKVLEALRDETVIKTAFNANFERTCLSRYLKTELSPVQWRCTAVQAAMLGLPLSLERVQQVLGLEVEKMKEGKELIRYFSMPCKAAEDGPVRRLPADSPEKWELFKAYCKRDVEVEREIRRKLQKYPITEKEQELYILDQQINDRGIAVDMELVKKAIECDRGFRESGNLRIRLLTGLSNPNSAAQLKDWLLSKGIKIKSLSKKNVVSLIKNAGGEVREVLKLRQQLAKTSVKKYEAIHRAVCPDGRVRGLLQFYGANRTGRWAGRLVQVHNLPQNHIQNLEETRSFLKAGNFEILDMLYESVPEVLSELIRTAFIPSAGSRLLVADFSAIEARVLAWLAGEQWRMEVFRGHGKIYEASASKMFRVPMESITKGSPLRQKGKIAELALGYGGSVGALRTMGALEMGLYEEELQTLVNAWRSANPKIVKFWWDVDKTALNTYKDKSPRRIGNIGFSYESGILFITLPSRRMLSYIKPSLEPNKFGKLGITYEGTGDNKTWSRVETYGPKLVENIVQAVSRDILGEAMLRLEKAGYKIILHVHDEVVLETAFGFGSLEEVCSLMAVGPTWAEGLELKAEGFVCNYYKKE